MFRNNPFANNFANFNKNKPFLGGAKIQGFRVSICFQLGKSALVKPSSYYDKKVDLKDFKDYKI